MFVFLKRRGKAAKMGLKVSKWHIWQGECRTFVQKRMRRMIGFCRVYSHSDIGSKNIEIIKFYVIMNENSNKQTEKSVLKSNRTIFWRL